jgi:hypothetical protein
MGLRVSGARFPKRDFGRFGSEPHGPAQRETDLALPQRRRRRRRAVGPLVSDGRPARPRG